MQSPDKKKNSYMTESCMSSSSANHRQHTGDSRILLFSIYLQEERSHLFFTGHDFRQVNHTIFCLLAKCLFSSIFGTFCEPEIGIFCQNIGYHKIGSFVFFSALVSSRAFIISAFFALIGSTSITEICPQEKVFPPASNSLVSL